MTVKSSELIVAGVEFFLALKDTDKKEAEKFKSVALDMIEQGEFRNGIWVKKDGQFPGQSNMDKNTMTEEKIVTALCRIYAYANKRIKNKIESDIKAYAEHWLNSRTKNPYGAADNLMRPYFGMCGWLTHQIENMLYIGMVFKDEKAIEYAKDQYQWITGNNPFNKSFVVGFGERYDTQPFQRSIEKSIGGVVPGIVDENKDGIPEIMYNFQPAFSWKTQECCLVYTSSLFFSLALLDKLN